MREIRTDILIGGGGVVFPQPGHSRGLVFPEFLESEGDVLRVDRDGR